MTRGILALFLVGCLFALSGCKEEKKAAAQSGPKAVSVSTYTVSPQQVKLTMELPGRTASYRLAEIRPQVSGLILKRQFTQGSDVKAGQVLYQIDPAPFRAALNNAKASLEKAKAQMPSVKAKADRMVRLYKNDAISEQDRDDAVSAYDALKADIEYYEASVEKAKIDLRYTRVTSPISGRIGISNVTEGAIVTSYQTQPMATIQQFDPIYVDVTQSTSELLRLREAVQSGASGNDPEPTKVRLILENGHAYPQAGTLEFRDVTVDQTTGSVTLRAVFPNPDGVLLPGMFITAVVPEGVRDNAIMIPQKSVQRDSKGNPYVLIVDAQDKAVVRPLELNRAIGDEWLVESGLKVGDKVITEGLMKVRPGMAVQVSPAQGADSAPAGAEKASAQ
jgi:membrane fusion protein (multidrug efflux system)